MRSNSILFILSLLIALLLSCGKEGDLASPATSNGKSGSMARIVTKGNYLYAINNNSLKVMDISDYANPQYIKTVDIGMNIETIYPFGNYLFIGSNDAMYIFGLNDPTSPNKISTFTHVTSCDPVVANDSLAFVTLHYSEACNRWSNNPQIDVLDISNILEPQLITTYFANSDPLGLDIKDSVLFVCHGYSGIVVYDIHKLVKGGSVSPIISNYFENGFNAYDAIVWQDKLFVIGENGFYQFDYSNLSNLTLISSILKSE